MLPISGYAVPVGVRAANYALALFWVASLVSGRMWIALAGWHLSQSQGGGKPFPPDLFALLTGLSLCPC
jgi:hypothetical protein